MSLAVPPCCAQDPYTELLLCHEEMTQSDLVHAMICMVDLSGELAVDEHGHVYPLQ